MDELLNRDNGEISEEEVKNEPEETTANSEKSLDKHSDEISPNENEEKTEQSVEVQETAGESANDTAQQEETELPAEMSLEGRKTQLEEKVSAQLEKTPEAVTSAAAISEPPKPYATTNVYGYYGTGSYPAAAPSALTQQKQKMPSGAKSYIIVVAGLLVVFLFGFILECARAYDENGLFGGDLERFVDTDFDLFGKEDTDEEDDDEDDDSFGLFPFNFGDDGIIELPEDPEDFEGNDTEEDVDSDTVADGENNGADTDAVSDKITAAPDPKTVVNEKAANLVAEDQPKDIDSAEYTARKAYKRVKDSVVNVVVYAKGNVIGQEGYEQGTGTGIVISEDGYIITNSHVIEDNKEVGVEIVTTGGDKYEAVIVGFDTRTDLAVLKIDAKDLTPAVFVNSDQIEVGQDAIAVGNPGGSAYSNSLTRGCVSALNRTVPSNTLVTYIQTDAAINPGNSGGPLLNSAGQVMGITTIKIANTDYEGMGFAIPSNTVIEIANSVIAKGYVEGRVRLGIMATVYSGGVAKGIYGIEILEIQPDSPLKDTKIKAGDVIQEIDGEPVPDFSALYSRLGEYEPDSVVNLKIYRPPSPGSSGTTFEVETTLVADEGN